jgi:MFS family permease
MALDRRGFSGTWPLILALCLARALAFAARTHVVAFYPELMERMGVGYTASGMLFSAFMLSYAIVLTPMGAAADRYSPRWMMGGGLALMSAGTLALAWIPWFELALVARMVQGIGTAMIYAISLKMVAVSFPRGNRATALSIIEVVIGAGMLVTLTLFPILARWVSLQALFVSLGMVMAVAIPLAALLPKAPMGGAQPRRDLPPLRAMLGRPVYLLTAVAFLGLFVTNSFFSWLPTYFDKGLGLGKEMSGLLMAVMLLVEMTVAPISGVISDRRGRRIPVIQFGSVALAVASLAAMPVLGGWMPYAVAALAGASIGLTISPFTALATELFGPERAGVVGSFISAAGQAGGVVAGTVYGLIIDVSGSFRYVWLVGAALALLRIAVTGMMREERV